jgi:hypothetical protein
MILTDAAEMPEFSMDSKDWWSSSDDRVIDLDA